LNRRLPRGSAEPGPFRPERTPYLTPIYDAVLNPAYRRVVVCMATQSSKTEFLLNLLGHKLDDDPGPILFVAASQRQAEAISASRVQPMLDNSPSLSEKLDRREGKNKLVEKFVSGQRLGFAWAGSPTELSSHPCALVLIDELDRMPADVAGEGDPVALAEARTATYANGKCVVVSSPTIEGASRIWALWEAGTAAKWAWPCPECNAYFVPCYALLKWPPKATPAQAKREARLACPHCGVLIEERHKPQMNERGRFEMTGDPDSDTASYWISGLASPWRTWGACAAAWLEAAHSREPEQMQSIQNTVFGELFRLQGEAPPAARVEQLRGAYKFDEIPTGAIGLTAGIDVQADRLVYVIRAWGVGQTSWLIRHGELWGDTLLESTWSDLATLLEAQFGTLKVRMALVDSGYRPDMVYQFSRRFPGLVLPSKGHDQGAKPVYIVKLDVDSKGATQRRGVQLAHVDASYFKSWIHGRIAWPLDQTGAWHLPSDTTIDYCAQIVSEQRITKPNGAVKWIRTRTANHYLDAEVLATAAAHLLQVHLLREAPPVNTGDPPEPQPRDPVARWAVAPRVPQNFVTSWRK